MIEKILKERSMKLALEILNQGLEVSVETDIHTTDFTDTTGDELIRFEIDTDINSYNVFLRENRFNNEDSQPILYKNIAKAIIKCEKENITHFNDLLFLVVRNDIFNLELMNTKNIILNTEKAKNLYNILINDEVRTLDIISFEKKFNSWIFKINDIKVINILNIMYLLTA